ncbi:MAG: hypothetical protein U0165_05195, partial [Polyangiaceae bacterium]
MSGDESLFSTSVCDTHDFRDDEIVGLERPVSNAPFDGPFDHEKALRLYALGLPDQAFRSGRSWSFAGWPGIAAPSPSPLTRAEGHFWFNAATLVERFDDETPTFRSRPVLAASTYDGA